MQKPHRGGESHTGSPLSAAPTALPCLKKAALTRDRIARRAVWQTSPTYQKLYQLQFTDMPDNQFGNGWSHEPAAALVPEAQE